MLGQFTPTVGEVLSKIDLLADSYYGLDKESYEYFLSSVETRARLLMIQYCLRLETELPEEAIVHGKQLPSILIDAYIKVMNQSSDSRLAKIVASQIIINRELRRKQLACLKYHIKNSTASNILVSAGILANL